MLAIVIEPFDVGFLSLSHLLLELKLPLDFIEACQLHFVSELLPNAGHLLILFQLDLVEL